MCKRKRLSRECLRRSRDTTIKCSFLIFTTSFFLCNWTLLFKESFFSCTIGEFNFWNFFFHYAPTTDDDDGGEEKRDIIYYFNNNEKKNKE